MPAPEPPTTPLRKELKKYLTQTIEKAEAALKRLGRSPTAWKWIRVYLNGTMPSFGSDTMVDRLLGPMAPRRATSLISDGTFPTVRRIRRHAARCVACRERTSKVDESRQDHVRIAGVRECRPELFKQYLKERRQTRIPKMIDSGPAWRAACMAAVAAAALKVRDPNAAFAAGRFLEHEEAKGYLLRKLPREMRAVAARELQKYGEAVLQRQRRGGLAKRGKLHPHWELIRRCLVYDEGMAERHEPWLHNRPRNRGRDDVLRMLENADLLDDLLSGGVGGADGRRLPILGVVVDRANTTVEVDGADGQMAPIAFQALSKKIGKLQKA